VKKNTAHNVSAVTWLEIRHDDLEANRKLLSNGEEYFKIEPLK
jgi:hypothetical protein